MLSSGPVNKRESFKKNVIMVANLKVFPVFNAGGNFLKIPRNYALIGF